MTSLKPRRDLWKRTCKGSSDKLGWTPEVAFADSVPTPEEKFYVQSILPPSVQQKPKRTWEEHTFKCIQQKCARKAYFGFDDEAVPRFCELHKIEGMVELVAWKPSFKEHARGMRRYVPSKRGIPMSMRTPTVDDNEKDGDSVAFQKTSSISTP
jgi:hypothetical protein